MFWISSSGDGGLIELTCLQTGVVI
jgi:hypothetical protein